MSYQLPIQGGSGAVCQTSWIHNKVMGSKKKPINNELSWQFESKVHAISTGLE